MDDRELLELAAKAAGYVVLWYDDTLAYGPTFGIEVEPGNPCGFDPWNPLTDDGDALRLAYSAGLCVLIADGYILVSRWYAEKQELGSHKEKYKIGDSAPVRRAIVRAAAQIGRSTPGAPRDPAG